MHAIVRCIGFSKSLESNLITRTFLGEISRILFALFVHYRFRLHCLCVAIAHLMQNFLRCNAVWEMSVRYFGKKN